PRPSTSVTFRRAAEGDGLEEAPRKHVRQGGGPLVGPENPRPDGLADQCPAAAGVEIGRAGQQGLSNAKGQRRGVLLPVRRQEESLRTADKPSIIQPDVLPERIQPMPAEDALLFIDANKYLDLYRTAKGKKLLAPLGEQVDYIFVTRRVVEEVQRNKILVAAEFLTKQFRKLKLQPFSAPDHLHG